MTEREKLSSSFSIESLLSPNTAKQEDSREKWHRHPQLTKRKANEKGKDFFQQIFLFFFKLLPLENFANVEHTTVD